MNEIVSYGLLIAALVFVINGLRWWQAGGNHLIVLGVSFALIGTSGLIGPKFTPVLAVAFVVGVIGLAVSFYSRGAEARAKMRAEIWLAFALFAAIGALLILGLAGVGGTVQVIMAGILGVLGAAFIIVTMTRLALAVRADRDF